jgi:hypothetical protein
MLDMHVSRGEVAVHVLCNIIHIEVEIVGLTPTKAATQLQKLGFVRIHVHKGYKKEAALRPHPAIVTEQRKGGQNVQHIAPQL